MTPIYKCLANDCNKAVDRPGRVCLRCSRGPRTAAIDPVLVSDDVLRLFLLDPNNRTRVKDLMLTPGDDVLLQSVMKGHNTSSKIASLSDTAVSSISLRLADLRKRGYLTRVSVPQESGGYEWVYTNVFKPKETNDVY
jgi:hypothetical protein